MITPGRVCTGTQQAIDGVPFSLIIIIACQPACSNHQWGIALLIHSIGIRPGFEKKFYSLHLCLHSGHMKRSLSVVGTVIVRLPLSIVRIYLLSE